MPRTSPPTAPPRSVVGSAWPSTTGVALITPGTCGSSRRYHRIRHRRAGGIDAQIAVQPQDAAQQLLAEPVHHRHHDDQRRHAQRDTDQGEPGNDRNEAFASPRAQIAPGNRPLECVEHQPSIRAQRVLQRHLLALAVRAALQLHAPCGRPARPHHELPGMPHQIGIGELHPGPLLTIIVQRVPPEPLIRLVADRIRRRIALLRLRMPARNGATASGQMMPASSWLASMSAPTRRRRRCRSCPSPAPPTPVRARHGRNPSPRCIWCRNRRYARPRCRAPRAAAASGTAPRPPGHASRRSPHRCAVMRP